MDRCLRYSKQSPNRLKMQKLKLQCQKKANLIKTKLKTSKLITIQQIIITKIKIVVFLFLHLMGLWKKRLKNNQEKLWNLLVLQIMFQQLQHNQVSLFNKIKLLKKQLLTRIQMVKRNKKEKMHKTNYFSWSCRMRKQQLCQKKEFWLENS